MHCVNVGIHLYLCHPLVLSSPTLMMHGHMNLKIYICKLILFFFWLKFHVRILNISLVSVSKYPENRHSEGQILVRV